jgi:hypothetical protein
MYMDVWPDLDSPDALVLVRVDRATIASRGSFMALDKRSYATVDESSHSLGDTKQTPAST